MARILIADDEKDFREAVAEVLRGEGHEVCEFSSADEALGLVGREVFDVLLTDLRMPGRSGLELLREAARSQPDSIRIVMTAYGTLDAAIEAIQLDAEDFLLKPVSLEALRKRIALLLHHRAVNAENRFLRRAMEIDAPSTGLVGESPGIVAVHRLIEKVARHDTTVLITGETGSGKELVARAIHQAGPRREAPFVTINCGSIPEALLESELFGHVRGSFTGAERDKRGLFEVASDGTIFLDEIGEMPLNLQPKLLRALESKEIMRVGSTASVRVEARVLAATHRTLAKMIEENKFRSDLYYRLNVFEITLPPLRERIEDLPLIARHLLERISRRMNLAGLNLSPEALEALKAYPWPGNVRELANILERAVILAEGLKIGLADLPGISGGSGGGPTDDLKTARQRFEKDHITRVLARHGGDKKKAAETLGIDLSSLYRKLEDRDNS